MRAYQLRRLSRDREALAVLDRVLAAEPSHARALRLRSACLTALGEHDEAIAAARAAAAAAPQSASSLWSLSRALDGAGQSVAAVESARAAVALAPDAWTSHEQLAHSLFKIDPAAALGPAEQARELAPDVVATHEYCGVVYERLGRMDEARAAYERALALGPQSFSVHMRIARLDKKAGRWDEALRGYSRAAALNPKSAASRRQIESLVGRRLTRPFAFAFGAAAAASADFCAADAMAVHVLGAVLLGMVAGVCVHTLGRLRHAVGPALRHILRTDAVANVLEAATATYAAYVAAMTETPLFAEVHGYVGKLCGVFGVLVLVWLLARRGGPADAPSTVTRTSGNRSRGRRKTPGGRC